LVAIACVVGIVAGLVFIGGKVKENVTCFDIPYVTKGCITK
jgi:hypothetical protein